MADAASKKDVAYFEYDGKPYGVPLDDEATLRAFMSNPEAKQISPYEVDVLLEAEKMREEPVLGRLEALGRGVVSGATVGLGQLAMDPIELAASKEAYPGAFYTGDIGTGIATSALSLGALGKTRLALEGAKAAGKGVLGKQISLGARALSKVTPAGITSQVGNAAAKVPLALAGTNPVSASVRSITPFAIQGAVEGSVAGLGYGAADEYLKDPNKTVQDLLSSNLDSAAEGAILGTAIPGGIGLLKTAGAGTIKGASKIAKSIYGKAADAYGEKFSNGLSKFIASETPEVQEALAQELQKVIQFGQNYSDIEKRVRAVQDSAKIMREQGLETREIQRKLSSTISQIKSDIKKLNTAEVKAANSKLKTLLADSKKRTQAALKQGEADLTANAIKPIREAADQFEAILGPGGLGDTSRRVIDEQQKVAVSMIDSAIGKQLDDEILSGAIGEPFQVAQKMVEAQDETIRLLGILSTEITPKTGAHREVIASINKINTLKKKIQEKIAAGTITPKELKEFYLAERQLIRNLNEVPRPFIQGAAGADRNSINQFYNAKKVLEEFHRGGTFGKAGQLEGARADAVKSIRGLIDKVRGAQKAPQIEGAAADIASLAVNSNQGLDRIISITQETMGDEFAQKLSRSFRFAKSKADEAQKSIQAVADFQRATDQVKTLKPGLDPVTVPELPGTSADELIAQSYDDLNSALLKSVDDFMSPDAMKEVERLRGNLQLEEATSEAQGPGGKLFEQRLKDKASEAGVAMVEDENIQRLLRYRSSSAPGGMDFLDAIAAIDLATGLPLPNSVSGAILGINRLKGRNFDALQSISRVAETVRKTDQKINKAADWALNAAVEGKSPGELIQGTSILGKILGVTIGQAYLPSEGE